MTSAADLRLFWAAGLNGAKEAPRSAGRVWLTAAATGSWLALYGAWQVFGWPAGHRELISDLSFVPVSLGAALCAGAAARRCHGQPRLRSAWKLVGLACAAYTAGDLTWMVYAMLGDRPYPSAADGFYLLFYPLMLCGLLRMPARRQDFAATIRLTLDVAVVAIAGAVVVTYLVLGPTLAQGGASRLVTAFSIAYPVGDVILLLGVASVFLRIRDVGIRNPLRLVGSGLVCFVAGDLVLGYISLHGTYQSGSPVDTVWMAAMALFAVAAATQRPPVPAREPDLQQHQSASWLPYVALAIAFGLLVFSERNTPMFPDLVLVVSAVILTAIISTRQYLTQRDLAQARRELHHKALHDDLTGLPNRAFLVERAQQMLARARRNGTKVAVLYIDLDGFKAINDTLGHASGDDVLRVVAARLSGLIRASDSVGRLGGDEFVVLLEDLSQDEEAQQVAGRTAEVLAAPIELDGFPDQPLVVTASIGIAVAAEQTIDELLHDADTALYEVKKSGKHNWAQFALPGDARKSLRAVS